MLERKQAVVNFVAYVCLVAFHGLSSVQCFTLHYITLFYECGSCCHIGIAFICCLFCQYVVDTAIMLHVTDISIVYSYCGM